VGASGLREVFAASLMAGLRVDAAAYRTAGSMEGAAGMSVIAVSGHSCPAMEVHLFLPESLYRIVTAVAFTTVVIVAGILRSAS